jgi:hypothetical protein
MDLGAFYGVVATVDFALLGLWWVTVQTRPDLRRADGNGRMSYLVSLQFVVPGTSALLAQVAPEVALVWRVAFTVTSLTGIIALFALGPRLSRVGSRVVTRSLWLAGLPLYVIVIVVAGVADLFAANAALSALQVEAILFCLLSLVATQVAWAAAMSPELKARHAAAGEPR